MNIPHTLSILTASLVLSISLPAQDDALQIDPETHTFTRAQNLFHAARQAKGAEVKKQLFSKAIVQLEQYLRNFPQNINTPMVKYFLGYSYSQTGKLRDARLQFDNLIRTHKKGQAVIYAASYMAYDAGVAKNYKKSAEYYTFIATQSSDKNQSSDAYYKIGICMEYLKKPDSALKNFSESIKLSNITKSSHQQSLIRIGKIYVSKNDYANALSYFSQASAKEASSSVRSEGYYLKGLCLQELGQPGKAAEAYEQVLKLTDDTRKPEAIVALMSAKYSNNNYDGVIKLAETPGVVIKGKLQGKKDILAGQSYLKLKEYRNAVEAFNRVIRLHPNSDESFEAEYRKILCYYNLKSKLVTTQVNNFIRLYGNKYRTSPLMHSALLLQAETLFEERNFKAASGVYKQINLELTSEAKRPNLMYKRAWCHYEIKNYRSCIDNFNSFLKKYPEDKRQGVIFSLQAQCYIALKDNRNALTLFDKIIKFAPDTPLSASALQASAKILKDQEKHEEMVKRYLQLLASTEKIDPLVKLNAHYWVAWGEFKQKNFKSSLKQVKEALKIDKGAYAKQLTLLEVLCNYRLKEKDACVAAAKKANTVGITSDIPIAVYRWLGIQCFRSEEYADAETYLALGVANQNINDTPALYWRLLGKAQYFGKHYEGAFKSITNAIFIEKDPSLQLEMKLYLALTQNARNQPEVAKNITILALNKKPSGKTKASLLKLLGDLHFKEQNYKQAAISFSSISEFYEDKEILPYAISMVIKSLELSNKPTDATFYREKLKKQFPEYKLPE